MVGERKGVGFELATSWVGERFHCTSSNDSSGRSVYDLVMDRNYSSRGTKAANGNSVKGGKTLSGPEKR